MESKMWSTITEDAKEFVSLCINVKPSLRRPAKKLLEHIWLKDGFLEEY